MESNWISFRLKMARPIPISDPPSPGDTPYLISEGISSAYKKAIRNIKITK